MRKFLILLLFGLSFSLLIAHPVSAVTETVYIEASRDNTLIEHPDGVFSNGSGPFFFVGRTNQEMNSIRRGLLHFDVADALPEDAVVTYVSLSLYLTQDQGTTDKLKLHRLKADWGEGASISNGGMGAPSQPGDATWIHTFYPDELWTNDGGDYINKTSAHEKVADQDYYIWNGPRLTKDVIFWQAHPNWNYGWILIGNEKDPQTAKRFASRENANPDLVPILEITYEIPDE
jgi:hypothetical protein